MYDLEAPHFSKIQFEFHELPNYLGANETHPSRRELLPNPFSFYRPTRARSPIFPRIFARAL